MTGYVVEASTNRRVRLHIIMNFSCFGGMYPVVGLRQLVYKADVNVSVNRPTEMRSHFISCSSFQDFPAFQVSREDDMAAINSETARQMDAGKYDSRFPISR